MRSILSGRATLLSADMSAPYINARILPVLASHFDGTKLRLHSFVDASSQEVGSFGGGKRAGSNYAFLEAIVDCDLLIADVTALHPAMAYYIGLRDGLTIAPTLFVSAGPCTALPVSENWARQLFQPDDAGAENQANMCLIDLTAEGVSELLELVLLRFALVRQNEAAPIRMEETTGEPLISTRYRLLRSTGAPKAQSWRHPGGCEITVFTGPLTELDGAEVWVNPENTLMEMARVVSRSVSGRIRYLGANWTENYFRTDDHMRVELARRMGGRTVARLGDVLPVRPHPKSRLARENRVRQVLNVAAISHERVGPSYSYGDASQIAYQNVEIRECLRAAFQYFDRRAGSGLFSRGWNVSSLMTPLINQGGFDADVRVTAHIMVNTIFDYLGERPDTKLRRIIIAAREGFDEAACRRAIENEMKRLAGEPVEE